MRRRDVSRGPQDGDGEVKNSALDVVKEFDAFGKVADGYKETTASGGGISILVFGAILILVVSEVRYYTATEMVYRYSVDTAFNGKLKINIDLTVAMRCSQVGADVLDLTGQTANTFGKLEEENVNFELSPRQRDWFNMMTHMNDYMRNEYHALHDFLWKTGFSSMSNTMPKREDVVTTPNDACRLQGSLEVNKVAGNFHITAGKSIKHPAGHAHLAGMVNAKDYNFTHRINQFSFGEPTPGIINPLDGVEKTADENYHMFQYFIQVVPTKVSSYEASLDTYQYAVTEKNRTISHTKGSHGVPGIFVKYDLSSLMVSVSEEHKPYWQFLIRLCGIVGGIFATSGLLHQLSTMASDVVCCRYQWGKYKPVLPMKQASKTIDSQPPGQLANKTAPVSSGLIGGEVPVQTVNLMPT